MVKSKKGTKFGTKFFLSVFFSDKKSGTLVLILELMDMNIYELIRGMYLSTLIFLNFRTNEHTCMP